VSNTVAPLMWQGVEKLNSCLIS